MKDTPGLERLRDSLQAAEPPGELPPLAKALWWEAKGEWNRAHEIAQEIESKDAAWVHAYLHRREGDEWNAGYWYRRAGQPVSRLSLEEEWRQIALALLASC
jgi:hypothetical protein